ACLVADAGDMTAHMERLMRRMGQSDVPTSKRILELNPDHATVQALRKLHAHQGDSRRIEEYAQLLLDQAIIAEGSKVKDPAAFARRVNSLILKDALTV
ncbi:MAG: molecular chaperone HtpG, partial [Gemmataceae bacterium]